MLRMWVTSQRVMAGATLSRAPAPDSGQTRCRTCFTLIELLVVIAIIAVLASMLMPALQASKEVGHKADCLNRAKQLATAHLLYIEDYDTYFLPAYIDNCMWSNRLTDTKFVADTQSMFYCNKVDPPTPNNLWNSIRWWPGYAYSTPYITGSIGYVDTTVTPYAGHKLAWLRQPAITAMFAECNVIVNTGDPAHYVWDQAMARTGTAWLKAVGNFGYGFIGRHVKGDNFVFCDGHGEYLTNPYKLTLQLKGVPNGTVRTLFPFGFQ